MQFQLYAIHYFSILSLLGSCYTSHACSEPHGIQSRAIQEQNTSSHTVPDALPDLPSRAQNGYTNHDTPTVERRCASDNPAAALTALPRAPPSFPPADSAFTAPMVSMNNSTPGMGQHPPGRDREGPVHREVAYVQAEDNWNQEQGQASNALPAPHGRHDGGVAVDRGHIVHLQRGKVETIEKLPAVGTASPGLQGRDTDRTSRPAVGLKSSHTLNENGPGPMPPATHSPPPPAPVDRLGVTADAPVTSLQPAKAFQAVVRHYQSPYDEARCSRNLRDDCQTQFEESKNSLSDPAYAHIKSPSTKSLAAETHLRQQLYRAATEHAVGRMKFERAERRLKVQTRPGTPANTYAKLCVAGIRPREPGMKNNCRFTTALKVTHVLNERSPAPRPPRSGSPSTSQIGQNWEAPANPNEQTATARKALRVTAKHYEPDFHEAKATNAEKHDWQEEANKSKDSLSDATYAHYMSDHKPPAEKQRLLAKWYIAASEHTADRMFLEMTESKLAAQTRPGTPASTYAKLRVAGIKPLRRRGSATRPPKAPSATHHTPSGTHSPASLAEDALTIVAEHVLSEIPAAQRESNQATEAFEKSHREIEGAAKAWNKPFIEAMYHSQQQGLDMNRRYRENNKKQHQANQHLRVLHETAGKLRDTGLSPRDIKRTRLYMEQPSMGNSALSFLAKHFQWKIPEAKHQLLQTARKARKTKAELDLQHRRHFDDVGDRPSWDLMDEHYGNIEKFHQARKHLFGLKKTLGKLDKVGVRPRAPADQGAGQGNQEPHPLVYDALHVIAQHSQRRIEDREEKRNKALTKATKSRAEVATHLRADTLTTAPQGLVVLARHRADNAEVGRINREWMELLG